MATPKQEYERIRKKGLSHEQVIKRMSRKNRAIVARADRAARLGQAEKTWVVGDKAAGDFGGYEATRTPDGKGGFTYVRSGQPVKTKDVRKTKPIIVESGDTPKSIAEKTGASELGIQAKGELIPGTSMSFDIPLHERPRPEAGPVTRFDMPEFDPDLKPRTETPGFDIPFGEQQARQKQGEQAWKAAPGIYDPEVFSSFDQATREKWAETAPGPKGDFAFQTQRSTSDMYRAWDEQLRSIYEEAPELRRISGYGQNEYGRDLMGATLFEEYGDAEAISEIAFEPWAKPFTVNYLNQFPGVNISIGPDGKFVGTLDLSAIPEKDIQRLYDLGWLEDPGETTISAGGGYVLSGGGAGGGRRGGGGGEYPSGSFGGQAPQLGRTGTQLALTSWRM